MLTDGEEGLLVPPRDAEALANALIEVLSDVTLAARMGTAGMETAKQYSWEKVAEQVLDFYIKTGTRSMSTYPASVFAAPGLVT